MELIDDFMNILGSSSSSSSSSSEDEDWLFGIIPTILSEGLQDSCKNKNFVEETVPGYSNQQFVQHFRVSREIVNGLAGEYSTSNYYPKKDSGFKRISPEKCILAFLWFASNEAASYRDVADRFDLSRSKLHDIIFNVTMFLSGKSATTIVWPILAERAQIEQEFNRMGFPGAIGCIDGTHIQIDAPSDDPESYLNRKKFYSVQMQVVCDNNRKIRDVFIGYPGSVHDARVFRNSPLSNSLEEKCGNFCILGDSAYPCLRNLLTPYKDRGNLTGVQRNFNKKLSHCRVLIEHTIGLFKQRFRQLYHFKARDVQFICHFLRACCVLHNICIENDIIETPGEEIGNNEENEEVNAQEEEEERNEVGLNYRNYVAAMLNI